MTLPSIQEPYRVYVADTFAHYERARGVMDQLTGLGYHVTHDWTRTREFGEDGHPNFTDAELLPPDVRAAHARNDVRGVRTADALIAIATDPLCGGLIEIGVAIAHYIPVFIVDPWRQTIFFGLDGVTVFPTVEEAIYDLGEYTHSLVAYG